MAHFARVDKNNIVQSVHVVNNEDLLNENGVEEEVFGIAYLNKAHGTGFTWVQTSYNNNFRKRFAAKGYTYDKVNDIFMLPRTDYDSSWTLDSNHDWQPPTAMPDDGKNYRWNEDTEAWVEIREGESL
jgi:hypothetical protein